MADIIKNLNIDYTIFIQFGIFAALFFILRVVFFSPFQKLIELRQKSTVGDLNEARQLLEEAQAKMVRYKDQLHEARDAARADLEKKIKSAKDQETKILNDARTEAKDITQDAVTEIEKEKSKLVVELEKSVSGLADQVTQTLLGGGNS